MISLTGDIATGKKVLAAAAKTLKRTHLELGGKAPVIVFDDADLDAVVEGVRAFGYYNAGQDCTAACRVYAGKKIYDKLVADLASAATSAQIQPARRRRERDRPADLRAPARRASRRFVERALELKHIEIAAGGKQAGGAGFFYEPTVVAGAQQEDEIVRREVFGPVVSVTRFDDVEQAVALGQRLRLRPRLLGVDARTSRKGMQTAARLHYGCTWVNCHFMLANEMPHGGVKQSGYGKDLSSTRWRIIRSPAT